MAAWIVGGCGAFLVGWIGYGKLEIPLSVSLLWVAYSNFVALAGVLLTLQFEKVVWIKRTFLRGAGGTWGFLSLFYFGLLLLLIPSLRELRAFAWMIVPLTMSTGLMLNPFLGPIQDTLVRRSQRRKCLARQ